MFALDSCVWSESKPLEEMLKNDKRWLLSGDQ